MEITRRRWLEIASTLAAASCGSGADDGGSSPLADAGSAADAGRGDGASDATARDAAPCAEQVPADPTAWLAVPMASLPDLATKGGAVLDDAASLLHVWVVDLGAGCYEAVWRICTHGSCNVDYDGAAQRFVCPCHGARFDLDGQVLAGPAPRPLRVLPVDRSGDTLYVRKPFA